MNKIIAGLMFALVSTSAFAECVKQRTLILKSSDYPLVGTGQYKTTLPLNDREIVLTFDDGPVPNTLNVLKILDRYCLKATFFVVGEMVEEHPQILQQEYSSGHNIANHSLTHPMPFNRLFYSRQVHEIDQTNLAIKQVIGNNMFPAFRFPGLGRTTEAERYLNIDGISVWSVDIETKDYKYSHMDRSIATQYIVNNALASLEHSNHRGIILMHDIHRNTAEALPVLLDTLIWKGYTFVHVKFI